MNASATNWILALIQNERGYIVFETNKTSSVGVFVLNIYKLSCCLSHQSLCSSDDYQK